MLRYFRELSRPKLLLWSYLLWYLFFVARYFESDSRLWLNSLGIAALIGTALVVSTVYAKADRRTDVPPWAIFRFYLMPFCVSSFASTTKGKGFVLVLSAKSEENLAAFGLIFLLVFAVEFPKLRRAFAARNALASAREFPLRGEGGVRPLGGDSRTPSSSL